MVKVNEAFEIKYKKKGKEVQLLIDFDKLQEFRKNPEKIPIEDVVADDKIYTEQSRGEIASEQTLKTIFETIDENTILHEILINGDCQIPTAYLNKLREEKKRQVINYVVENAFNPQTNTKFTYSMIESIIESLHCNFDPLKDSTLQAETILKDIKKKVPISMNRITMILKIPGMYCGKFYGPFRNYGTIQKEYFDEKGNLHLHLEIPEGKIDDVATFIKTNSNGEGEYYIQQS